MTAIGLRATPDRAALVAGAAAGPMYAAVILAQALTRDGFDLADHPLSLLSLGPGGWVQTADFLVCGAAFAAAGLALRRGGEVLTPWAARLVATFGVATVLAGVFPTDPWNGYPAPGPEVFTWHGVIHSSAAGVGGMALIVAAVLVARGRRRTRPGLAAVSLAVAVVSLVAGSAGSGTGEFRLAFASGVIAWIWASAVLAADLVDQTSVG